MTWLDSRALDWELFPGFERAYRKVLVRDDAGEPGAFVFHLPGSFATKFNLPHRHRHLTTHEFGFCLGGEFPHWEYRDADQQHGVLVARKPGYFMSRSPGSLHGREPGPFTRVGYTSLMWRTGTGNWIPEPNFDEETETVDFADDWQEDPGVADAQPATDGTGTLVDWADLKLVDTRAMDWEDAPAGELRKALWRDEIELRYLPPGRELGPAQERECVLVLEGGLGAARQGFFADRAPGDEAPGAAGPTGAVLLRFRWPPG